MKIHRISKKQKTRKCAANDLDLRGNIKNKEQSDQYTVRSMLNDLDKWENFLS